MIDEIRKRKRELRLTADRHEKALKSSYQEISEDFLSGRAKMLMIGGGLAVTYWLLRLLILGKDKSRKEIPADDNKNERKITKHTDNEILNLIKEKTALFLVDLAQQVIVESIRKIDK